MLVYLLDEIGETRPGDRISVRISGRRFGGTKTVLEIDDGALLIRLSTFFHTLLDWPFLGFILAGGLIRRRWECDDGFGIGLFTDDCHRPNRRLLGGEQLAQWFAEVTDVVPPFGKKKGCRRASTRLLAADEVLAPLHQLAAFDPYYRPWNISRVAE